jgi:hypothetical protein
VRKNRRPPFDQAQDERLSARIGNYAIPFVLRLSKHERIFSHDQRIRGAVARDGVIFPTEHR